MRLVITIDFEDDSDFYFLRARCIAVIEEVVEEFTSENRNEGAVDVDWVTADG